MPRFAANLAWLFTEHPFLERFAAARLAGFDAVEFPSPYEHDAAEIAARLREHRLACVLFNLPMGDRARGDIGYACRPERAQEFREGVERAVECARLIRPWRVNCIAGTIAPGEDRALLESTLVANLRHAVDRLGTVGVPMLLEPLNDHDNPRYLVTRQDDGARIIREVGAGDRLGLQCDLYHTVMMEDDPSATLARLGDVIRHVQFADAPGRNEPGTGKVPLARLFAQLDAAGYPGWVSAEYRPSKRTEDTLGWLRAPA